MKKLQLLFIPFLFLLGMNMQAQGKMTAEQIIKTAEEKFRGEESSYGEMTLVIQRPTWKRSISIKSWSKGTDYSLSLVTAPANEKGQAFLKRKNELWSWNPTIARMIKLPPSMMTQGWMGSDYTNDDIMRESSISEDYDSKLLGTEVLQGYKCYKIELVPRENANIVWGKIIAWIAEKEYYQLKAEYYDEDNYLVRTMTASDVKQFGDRKLPARMEILPEEDPGNKTIVIMNSLRFNEKISESFFSQQNMKRVR